MPELFTDPHGLYYKTRDNDADAIRAFLDAGGSPHEMIERDRSLFDIAIDHRSFEVAKLLFEAGADALPSLGWAINYDHFDVLSFLLDNGVNVNSPISSGETSPLSFAVLNGNKKFVLYLLAQGADPNFAPSKSFGPPILCSLSIGKSRRNGLRIAWKDTDDAGSIIKALLDSGADISIRDTKGRTLLDNWLGVSCAMDYPSGEAIVDMLLSHDAPFTIEAVRKVFFFGLKVRTPNSQSLALYDRMQSEFGEISLDLNDLPQSEVEDCDIADVLGDCSFYWTKELAKHSEDRTLDTPEAQKKRKMIHFYLRVWDEFARKNSQPPPRFMALPDDRSLAIMAGSRVYAYEELDFLFQFPNPSEKCMQVALQAIGESRAKEILEKITSEL